MDVFWGFDPGGAGNYGWCICTGDSLPLQAVCSGVADSTQHALAKIQKRSELHRVLAAGIDAPLFWRADGDRCVDSTVRQALGKHAVLQGQDPPKTGVLSVNSLRGACLVQGVMTGMALRRRSSDLPITESHPKAMLSLLSGVIGDDPTWSSVVSALVCRETGEAIVNEHERDAALAAVSAFALKTRLSGWEDLFLRETCPVLPIPGDIAYWMPAVPADLPSCR